MKLKPADIDHIIELIDQITDALTKRDFLNPQEQQLLAQHREYEQCTREIKNMERLLMMPTRAGEDKCRKLIEHYKNKRSRIKIPYSPDILEALQYKLSKAQTDHIKSTVPPLQKDLDLYLVPRWPEILALSTQGQFKQEIEGHFLKGTTSPAKNNILITVKTKLVDELQRIKAKLEYNQKQFPATTYTEPNTTPAKRHKKKAKICCLFKKITGWIFKKTWHFICAVVVAVFAAVIAAIVVDIFADFGWIERIKAFFTR